MMQEAPHSKEEQSLGELLAQLTREITTLVRQEAALAKTEMSQKLSRVGKDLAFLAAGWAVAYAGLLAIVAAIILGLTQAGLPAWLSVAVVGLAVAGGGYVLVSKGLNALKQEDLVPHNTIEALKEDRDEPASLRRAA